jgi:hypothetical protein
MPADSGEAGVGTNIGNNLRKQAAAALIAEKGAAIQSQRRRHQKLRGGARPACQIPHGRAGESLHDFVRRTDLTFGEWEYAIDFLTRTGQKCTPSRQEFILLSDVLGVSIPVDA